ncbi:aldo/keto reductase family oxidoreductase [Flavobacterium sp. H122]|uniref:aldo/keto reductase n=1 Tax=Flavobacterium sp. H122 TaxID=2529860 RepID=UPI0010AAC510|nr:aldo/keto reductase [Flavobacterium sp. H122]
MKPNLSRIIAGTMTWGKWGKNLNTNQMISLLETCIENGITTFDHADIYGGHTTEGEFGKAFKESGIERHDIQLITKCGIKYISDKRNYTIKHYDYTQEHIIWSVENSLKNLQTDFIDVLLLHRPSPLMQADEIAETIDKLRNQGKIRSFGVSNFTPSQTELIQQKIKIDYNQIQFSVTHHEAMTNGELDFMQLHSITPMAWNPLGVVFREDIPQTQRIKNILNQLAGKYNTNPDTSLLAWILQHPSTVYPVIGTTDSQRIKNSTDALSVKLELEDWFAIWTESMGNKVP